MLPVLPEGPVDVIVLGGAALDWVAQVDALPARDGLAFARSYRGYPGGSAANVAVGLARLGQRVGFVGKLGDDAPGRRLLDAFKAESIDVGQALIETDCPTASCFITVDVQGERTIVVLPGVSLIEHPDELNTAYLSTAQALYLGPTYLDVAAVAVTAARRGSCTVFYAPGPPPGAEARADLAVLLRQVDVLLVSRGEAQTLTGYAAPPQAAMALRAMGPPVVTITAGAHGAWVADDAGLTHVPAFAVSDVQDTTGAGDAFAAGLVAGRLEGLSWVDAARMGCAGAALKIRHVGARRGLPRREKVRALLDGLSPSNGI